MCRNTFQAFTGKLDKPIESEFKGRESGRASGTERSSLNPERRYGHATGLRIMNGKKSRGFTERREKTIYYRDQYREEVMIGIAFIVWSHLMK